MRFFILTKKHILTLIAVILSVTVISVFSFASAAKSSKLVPIYCVESDKKVVSLSFDAAWGNEDTEELITILDKYSISATFFVVGSWVDKYPESVKQLADAGHEIQNHSNSHPHMPQLSTEKMLEELNTCNDKIEKITGVRPTLFRAPYGDYNNQMIKNVESINMYTIQWDVDSCDWMEGHTAERIKNDVLKKVKAGSIILFHNAAVNTPAALPGIIESLIADGYSFSKISDLIYKENYTIDHTGKQCKIKDGD